MTFTEDYLKKLERSQTGKSAKEAGKRFERTVVNLFNKTYQDMCLKFFRNPDSGAFSTRNPSEKKYFGDISCNNDTFPFCIECKYHNIDFDISSFFSSKNSPILDFWLQTESQAHKANKEPLLVLKKRNSKKKILCLSDKFLMNLTENGKVNNFWSYENHDKGIWFYVTSLEEFLKNADHRVLLDMGFEYAIDM